MECFNYCSQTGRCLLVDIATQRVDMETFNSQVESGSQRRAEYLEKPAVRDTLGDITRDTAQDELDVLHSPLSDTIDDDGVYEEGVDPVGVDITRTLIPPTIECAKHPEIGRFGVAVALGVAPHLGLDYEELFIFNPEYQEIILDDLLQDEENWFENLISSSMVITPDLLRIMMTLRPDLESTYNDRFVNSTEGVPNSEVFIKPTRTTEIINSDDIFDCVLEIYETWSATDDDGKITINDSFAEIAKPNNIRHTINLGHRYRDKDLSDIENAEIDEDPNAISLVLKDEINPENSIAENIIVFDSEKDLIQFLEIAITLAQPEQISAEFFKELFETAKTEGVVFSRAKEA